MADTDAIGLGETVADTQTSREPSPGTTSPERTGGAGNRPALGLTMRSTVLPRLAPGESPARVGASGELPRFEPLRLLGQGGIGEVTLVRDNDIDRPVALKRLRSEAQSEEGLHRFVHEIRTVGQLEHPNIAPIHDVGIDDHGQHYFVMRYVEGETLEQIIAKLAAGDPAYHRRFTFEYRAQIFLGVLNAVNYAHSKQIIHRDIKPSNIMVGPYGEVVVMDWGIAKKKSVADGSRDAVALAATLDTPCSQDEPRRDPVFRTRHGTLIGTPAYMSPEQAAAKTDEIDERSDVYSLCAVFYELLALQHYLPGRTTVPEMLASVMKDRHVKAMFVEHPHQPVVPAELAWFIEKGLEKDPAKRYQSVAEMHEQLQRVMAGGFAVQCYITFMKRTGNALLRFIDQHPRLVALGGALWIAITILGLLAAVHQLAG
ncbi:MAG TPA: serine/threonine-protein kinase [Kofleriaceae bacterium]|nr:serine/threonine-protein kinase [Kofleriaceae bacterium]